MDVNQTIPTVLAGCLSGSIGDTVFSHNQHGPYTRPRVTPFYPGSTLQLQMAQAMLFSSIRWEALNAPLKATWQAYAEATPMPDSCGRMRLRTKRDMWFRAGLVLWYNKPFLEPSPGPPKRPGLSGFRPVRIEHVPPDRYLVFFDDTESWVSVGKGFMQVQFTNGPTGLYPDTVNFFRGPYESRVTIDSDLFSPPTSPFLYFGSRINPNTHRYARIRLLDSDGRVSNPQLLKIFP